MIHVTFCYDLLVEHALSWKTVHSLLKINFAFACLVLIDDIVFLVSIDDIVFIVPVFENYLGTIVQFRTGPKPIGIKRC